MNAITFNVNPLALTREDAATALGMSLDSFERHVQPEVRLVRRGKLRLAPTRSSPPPTARRPCSSGPFLPPIGGLVGFAERVLGASLDPAPQLLSRYHRCRRGGRAAQGHLGCPPGAAHRRSFR